MTLTPGSLDGRIELRELLGEGGMGEVHAAWDRSLERPVAVKFVRGSDPRDAARLLLEARLQARIEHPNVVRVFEVGSLGGRSCIVLQLVRGKSLAELAAGMSVPERVELVRQAALGLHAAHLQGLVHRDVKPGNILVEEAEEGGARTALVTDFGLAHAEGGGLTRSGLLPGTLDFMAPEQLAGGGPVDFRSDVYSLGATLYAVLAGRPPFRIPSANADSGEEQVKLLRRVMDEEPPPLRKLVPGVPEELSLIASKAMEKEPGARYASAEALAGDLSRFQRGETILARPASLGARATKWARRNPTAARAVGAALAVLIAAGGFSLWVSRRASIEALEAARLGAMASSLEGRMRMEYLLPPHDLRPALTAVKSEVERLKPAAARRDGGPASFALGKGLELTGDLDGARAAYARAWDLGFRTPQAAEGLGTVLGRIYQREYTRARETLPPAERPGRLAALRTQFRDAAQRSLERADAEGWRGPYLRAQVALLDEDFTAARTFAGEALAADAGRYEARVVEGESWLLEAKLEQAKDQNDAAAIALEKAAPALEEALKSGRSDLRAHLLLADVHNRRLNILLQRARDPAAAFASSLEVLDRAAILDPDEPAILLNRARALLQKGRYDAFAGRRAALPMIEEAAALLRRAIQASPQDSRPLVELAYVLSFQTLLLREWSGASAAKVIEEGLAVTETALKLAPGDLDVVRARAGLLLYRATDQVEAGEDPTAALDELERRCRDAEHLDPARAPSVQEVFLQGLEVRARSRWRRGADPRPVFQQAIALGEQLLATARGRRSATSQLSTLLTWYALVLLEMGEDPASQMTRALALAEQDLARHPDLAGLLFTKAQFLAVESSRLAATGREAAPAIREARRLIAAASRGQAALSNLADTEGLLSLVEARDLMRQGRSPASALDRCERAYAGAGSTILDREKGLASCALERARWLAPRPSAAGAASRGLAHASRALELGPRDPAAWVLKARLQALAGDRAAGRETLDRAYELQPLVRGSREAKAAEAELAR